MRINTTDNYLRLATRALDEILLPELQSSSAKTAVEMLKATLLELRKRETVAPAMLVAVIKEGYELLAAINHQLGDVAKAKAVLRVDVNLPYSALINRHEELSNELSVACEALAITSSKESLDLLRAAAEWELSYYTRGAELAIPEPEAVEQSAAESLSPKQGLDKELLEQYLNSIEFGQCQPVVLTKFQALPGGFGKQTYMCAFNQKNGESRELVVRKMDPMPIMAHGACKLASEYALLCALPESYPAPKPIAYAANWGNLDGDFYIMDRTLGDVPGAFLGGISGEVPEQVFLDLARYLGHLHSLPVEQFSNYAKEHEQTGVIDGDTQQTYRKNLDGWLQYMKEEEHLQSPYRVWLVEWMANNIPVDERTPILVHGDFNIHNVLVEEGRIACILDWECAGFGAAEQDLAYIRPHISQHIDWQKFVDHYLAHGGREPREDLMNYGLVYAALRTNLAGNKATLNGPNGRYHDLRYAMVELGFTPSFMNLALQSSKN
jgi:aminoglycoside phosphotransferase (APT) family kinase protein